MEKVEFRRNNHNTLYLIAAIGFSIFSFFIILSWAVEYFYLIITTIISWGLYLSFRKKGEILLNNEGFFEDGKLIVHWKNIKKIEEDNNFFGYYINIHLSDGTQNKISVSGISNSNRIDILEFIDQKLTHNKGFNADKAFRLAG